MAGLLPTVAVEYYSGSWLSLTADVLRDAGISIQRGLDGGRPEDRVAQTGTCQFELRNDAKNSGSKLGYYSPDHTNVRSGWTLGAKVRVKLTDPTTSTVYTVFIGRIDAIDPVPGQYRERRVRVTVVDWFDEAARWFLTGLGQQVSQRADQLLTTMLAQMPTQPEATSFDTGRDAYPYAFDRASESNTSALEELARVAASELGYIFLKGDGTLRFENRHSRVLDTTVDATFTDASMVELQLASSRNDIINTVRVTVWPRIVDASPTTLLYEQQNPIYIGTGETRVLIGPYRDPSTGDTCGGVDMQPLVSGTDYRLNTNSDGTGTDLTASATVTVNFGPAGARFSVTNGSGSNGYITVLRAIGKGVYANASVTLEATDATSKSTYGERVSSIDMPYQASADIGQAAATWLKDAYKDPSSRCKAITIMGSTTALVTQGLSRDISDRIKISETVTGLSNDEFFIQSVRQDVLPSGHLRVSWGLSPAPAAATYWILGTTTLGSAGCIPAPF